MNLSCKANAHLLAVKIAVLLLLFISPVVSGQNTITGIVSDNVNIKPIPDATVYINGTTIGTSTNENGLFTLKEVTFPCKLIISRIGYDLMTIDIAQFNPERLTILLREKTIQLSEVEVTGKNSRDKSVQKFRNIFFGSDSWSKKILLENESVLTFSRYTDTIKHEPDSLDKLLEKIELSDLVKNDSEDKERILNIFSVRANAPIKVDFPELGFKLSIDLVQFNIIESPGTSICKYLAYYFYQPYPFKNNLVERKFQKKRTEAFYNSKEHFCRSLFSDRLKQNGYVVMEYYINDSTQEIEKEFVNFNDFMRYKSRNESQIVGLKGRTFYIFDFFNYSNKPIDMTHKRFNYSSENKFWATALDYLTSNKDYLGNNNSTITFTSDTCTIRSDGTILDEHVLFAGKIIKKKVDAMIPDFFLKDQ